MNNLEGILPKDVTRRDGTKYLEFRNTLRPNYFIIWRDIALGYLLLIGTIAGYMVLEITTDLSYLVKGLLVLPFALTAAFWLGFIQLFVHEAAHYNIHPDKKKNDWLANVFLGIVLGIHIKAYRKTHWKHHQRLGHTDDTENSYFNSLKILTLLKMLTGVHAVLILLNRNKKDESPDSSTEISEKLIKKQKVTLLIGGLLNFSFLVILFLNSLYFTCATWIFTVIIFYPFFAALRQILEHRDEKFRFKKKNFHVENHGKVSRIFKTGIFSFFFGGAGFNRHMIHHWDPQLSYTNLPVVEDFLLDTDQCGQIITQSRTTYLKTFINLIEP